MRLLCITQNILPRGWGLRAGRIGNIYRNSILIKILFGSILFGCLSRFDRKTIYWKVETILFGCLSHFDRKLYFESLKNYVWLPNTIWPKNHILKVWKYIVRSPFHVLIIKQKFIHRQHKIYIPIIVKHEHQM